MPQVTPPYWTEQQLRDHRAQAIAVFRTERMSEPLEIYLEYYQKARESIETILELSLDLTKLVEHSVEVLSDRSLAECCRYLASPPISADDLKILADRSIAPTVVARNPEHAKLLMSTILLGLDRERFPWVAEERDPTEAEFETAIVSTSAMLAMRQAETYRRNEGKNQQEQRVRDFLVEECGFVEVAPRAIENLYQAPEPGHFCRECMVGSRKADVVVRLWDGRLMPIECKVSNSSTNSYKRINNDAAVKAVSWKLEFGEQNVVPAATLSGVFALKNLTYAQDHKLTLLWAHNLASLKSFIDMAI